MKHRLGQLLARPKVTYLALTATALFLALFAVFGLIFSESATRDIVQLLLVLAAIGSGWVSWLSYILDSRRAMKQLRDDVRKSLVATQKNVQQTTDRMIKDIATTQAGHVDEYNKQAYNVLRSVQKLRLAVLAENDPGLRDE